MRQIKQIIEIKFVLMCISLIIIDMSTYIIHDGYCIEYGTFILGLFFPYLTPSIWICFETPYSHIPVRIVKWGTQGALSPSIVSKKYATQNHFSRSKDWQSSAPKICTLRAFEPNSNQTLPWLGCSSCPHKPTQPQ